MGPGGQQPWTYGVPTAPAKRRLTRRPVFWVAVGTVVRVLDGELVAFALGSGERRWSEVVGGEFCALSSLGSDGHGYAWDRLVLALGQLDEARDAVVAVDRDDPARVLWRAPTRSGCSLLQSQETERTVVVARRCGGANTLASYDTSSGRRLWQVDTPSLESIHETSPPTVVTAGPRSDILLLDDVSGRVVTRVEMGGLGAADVDDAVVVGTSSTEDITLAGYDLDSGEKRWHRVEESYSVTPMRRFERAVLTVAVADTGESKDAVLKLSPTTGAPEVLAALPPRQVDIDTEGDAVLTGRHLAAELGIPRDGGSSDVTGAPVVYG